MMNTITAHAEQTRYTKLGGKAVALAIAAAVLGGCAKKPAPTPAPPPTVTTSVALAGSVTPAQTLPGIIAPYQNVAIQSTLSEPADSVVVQEGDRVHRGQLLAQLDTADLEANLKADLATASGNEANTTHLHYAGSLAITQGVNGVSQAEATLDQSLKTLATDQRNLQRDQQLYASGYVALQAVQQLATLVANDQQAVRNQQAALRTAKSLVQANGTLGSGGLQSSSIQQSRATEQYALSQAAQVRVQIQKAKIVSSVDGVVVNRALNPGEYPGTRQLFTLQQTDPVFAVVRGSGQQIARMRVGSPADIVVSDLRSKPFHGTVAAILNQINPGSTDFIVKVILKNPSGLIRPGMAVAANVSMPTLRGIRIPTTAFVDDTHTSVMTVRNGTIATAKVRESGGDGSFSVVSGLAPGTRVVSDGQSGFSNGQQVATR
jgi:multidrug efflux pump subunit AcrA (membrane-fusion protein)